MTVKTPDGVVLYGHNSREINAAPGYEPRKKGDLACVEFTFQPKLITGHYLISFGVVEQAAEGDEDVVALDRRYDVVEIFVTNYDRGFGLVDLGMSIGIVA
jgi:lipopolysaccharide transport system ATP-binding protein